MTVADATPSQAGPQARRRWSKIRIIGAAAVVLLLIAGGAAAYFGPTLLRGQMTAHTMMPPDTEIFLSFNPNLSGLSGARRLQEIYAEIIDDSQAVYDSYQQIDDMIGVKVEDMQSWIGLEAAVGISGIKSFRYAPVSSINQAGPLDDVTAVIVLASRDHAKATAFLEEIRDRQEETGEFYDEDTYQETTIWSRPGRVRSNPLNAFAATDDYVIFASSKRLLTATIDRATTRKDSLKDNLRFKHVVAALPSDRIGYVYIDGELLRTNTRDSAFNALAGEVPRGLRREFDDAFKHLEALEGIGLSLALEEGGIQVDSIAQYDLEQLDQETRDQWAAGPALTDRQVETISSEAFGFVSLAIPAAFKSQVADVLDSMPEFRDQRRQFERETGLDVQRDLLDWLDGEVTTVAVEHTGPYFEPLGSVYVAFHPLDKAKAQAGMDAVFTAIEQNNAYHGSQFQPVAEIAGQEWHVLGRDFDNTPTAALGWVGDDIVLGGSEDALHAATEYQTTMMDDATYQLVRAELPEQLNGLLYINLPRVLNRFSASAAYANNDADKWLRPVKGIGLGMSSAIDKQGTSHSRLFIAIGEL